MNNSCQFQVGFENQFPNQPRDVAFAKQQEANIRRQRAFAAIRESKADEETELWLRRLRDEAFVEIKM